MFMAFTSDSESSSHYIVSLLQTIPQNLPILTHRIPLSSTNWPVLLLPASLNFVLAFLSRYQDTRTLRVLLLPLAAFCCFHAGSHYFAARGYFTYNLGIRWTAVTQFTKALEFTFLRTQLNAVPIHQSNKTYSEALVEANELMSTVRGIGFEYGRSIPLPKDQRPLRKGPFIIKTFLMFLRSFITFDIIEFILKLTPPLRTPEGGSIYVQSLPYPQRIILASIIHIFTGCFLIETMQAGYHLATLISVGIFNQHPSIWPPVFDQPWNSDSLHQFWGQRWHQLLRRTFLVLGGFPCEWLGQNIGLGNIGMLFGTFLASGLYHEVPCYLVGSYFDWKPPFYFVSQALLICLERAWTVVTGKRVQGLWGRLWVYFSLIVLAQSLVDSWHMRGVFSGVILHGKLSPCRRIVLPLLNARFGFALYLEPGF